MAPDKRKPGGGGRRPGGVVGGQTGQSEPVSDYHLRDSAATIVLPLPPPLNNLFKNVRRGRAPTARYLAWRAEAGLMLQAQKPAPVAGQFIVSMTFRRPDRRARDLDNLAKAPLDLLVAHGVIEGDHLAQEVRLRWSALSPSDRGTVSIVLAPAGADDE